MANSQQTATAAALCQLKIGFRTIDTVQSTIKGMPAAGVLRAGDVITAVDGKPVTCRADVGDPDPGAQGRRAGARSRSSRHGRTIPVRLTTADVQGQPVVGVYLVESFTFPFSVTIRVGNIGGPSAGHDVRARHHRQAHPGQPDRRQVHRRHRGDQANGTVQPIGGIQQKMAGARAAGATIFLTPAANCPDTSGAVPAGMRLIKVSSLAGAIAALDALKAGRPVPSC